MELRQLRHFVAVAEELHFSRAAERLCLSQAALSASILRLEDECGIKLFERDTKRVSLTRAGERMLACAIDMLNQESRTQSVARALAVGRMGRVEVGFSGTVLRCGIDALLEELRYSQPEIEIVLREMPSPKQFELVQAGRLDAGFVNYPSPPEGLEYIHLFNDRYGVCLPAGHPLATRPSIHIAELKNELFAMGSRESAPRFYDQLMGLFTHGGFYPHIAIETGHLLSTLHAVASGSVIALLPESVMNAPLPGVVFVSLEEVASARSSGLVWDSSRMVPGLQALIDGVRELAEHKSVATTLAG